MARRIAVLVLPGCHALDAIGPYEVFAGAREVQSERKARDSGYEVSLVGLEKGPLRTESGLVLAPESTLARVCAKDAPPLHTLIVAGGRGAREGARDPRVVGAVRRYAARAERVASVCTGAFVLAAAGLLDGRKATTHWAFCDKLARDFPKVAVEGRPIYVQDGSVWTSAGVTAGLDLALAMVESDLGRDVASLVARWLVVFVRRAGGQSQFSAQLSVQAAERPTVRDLLAWIVENPDGPLSVPALAKRSRMSVRNFSRVFRSETGVSPASYVERVRVETARRLLETSPRSVDEVAVGAGFGTPEALRRAFARRIGLSPREYRARFSSALQRAGQGALS